MKRFSWVRFSRDQLLYDDREAPQKSHKNSSRSTLRNWISFIVVVSVLLLVALIGLQIFGSIVEPSKRLDGESTHPSSNTPLVEVSDSIARRLPLTLKLRGETEAKDRLLLQSEMTGRVTELPTQKGTRVENGSVICKLEEGVLAAELAEANARLEFRYADLNSAQKLAENKHRSALDLAAAVLRAESANVAYARAQRALNLTSIRAPFTGVIEDIPVALGSLMVPNSVCAVLLNLDPLNFVVHVSKNQVRLVTESTDRRVATVYFDTGDRLQGEVSFVSHAADPATGRYRIELLVPNKNGRFREGEPGHAEMFLGETIAHRIPKSALTLSDEGKFGIRIVDQDDIVQFLEAKQVGADEDTVWLSDLPQSVRLITFGQDYVRAGVKVLAQMRRQSIVSGE